MDRISAHPFEKIRNIVRGIGVRQVRLACGLVLFAYLLSHFLNHALGNISLEALADRRHLPHPVLAISPGRDRVLCRGMIHSGLGIWALYQRRQFRWRAIEPLQLVLGLSIPALIIAHIVGARLGHTLYRT